VDAREPCCIVDLEKRFRLPDGERSLDIAWSEADRPTPLL
jgi:hypothetical protein